MASTASKHDPRPVDIFRMLQDNTSHCVAVPITSVIINQLHGNATKDIICVPSNSKRE